MTNNEFSSADHAYYGLHRLVNAEGITEKTRNGVVLAMPGLVTWTLTQPQHRVLSIRPRANPFFHLYEAVWMLAGQNEVATLTQFVPRMKEFSDDGQVLNGAYGKRWRTNGQLAYAISMLRNDPETRRAFITHWVPTDSYLAHAGGKDVPCNVGISFHIRTSETGGHDVLDMTVFNRSNDLVWGACGSNVVHFTMLMEYVAGCVGVALGNYTTASSNLHTYLNTQNTNGSPLPGCLYQERGVTPFPLNLHVIDPSVFLADCDACVHHAGSGFRVDDTPLYRTDWFRRVMSPAMLAWFLHRDGASHEWVDEALARIEAADWRHVMRRYLEERRHV